MASLIASLRARPPLAAFLLVLAVLLATTDERSFGVVPDGKEMLSAGAAVAFAGELGVSRDFANAVPRDGGDGFSRYGMGLSLAEAPFLLAARLLHAVSPALPSAPVLVLLPVLSLAAAAWGVASAAGSLGASASAQLLAGCGLVLATPLWGYSGSDFSEPLQAALLGTGLAALAAHRAAPSRGRALAAGALLGALPLVKSLLVLVAMPLLAVALLPPRTAAPPAKGRKVARGATAPAHAGALVLGAAVPAALWLALELVRFGRPFGGYPGEDFSYPFLTGLLRLTLLPNKGLLVYAPVVLLALPGLHALARKDRPFAFGLAAAAFALLASASAWWAWDGQAAWGPRLVLTSLPAVLLSGALALDAGAGLRRAGLALAGAGLLVNLPGVLQPFPAVYALATAALPQPIDASRAAGTKYEVLRSPEGVLLATAPHHLSLTPAWWPPLVHARLLSERLEGGDVARRVADGALGLAPPLAPAPPATPSAPFAQAVSPFGWPFWGRSFLAPQPGLVDPLSFALTDQAVADLDAGRLARARRRLGLVLEREGASPDPRTLALAADAALSDGDADASRRLLARSPEPCHPWVLFVRAGLGADVAGCIPAEYRDGFLANVDGARRAGLRVSGWARAASRASGGG